MRIGARVSSQKETVKLLKELSGFKPGKPLLHYITHARFINFKGLERNARVDFHFPFTVIVGANGMGKSSILHGLFGMPEGYSTATFWFSTKLDPIEGKSSDPPRYIYGHWHQEKNEVVETRKARVYSKKRKYDYWEPTKVADGMAQVPEESYSRKSKDRWNPTERKVIYLNMRRVIGAFDRGLYFGSELEQKAKHAEMQAGSERLSSVIKRSAETWHLGGGRERIFEHRELRSDELNHVSNILGREYRSALYIRHSLYPNQKSEDVSVVFDRGLKYSEAYAGSGELAVVEIVRQILNADKYSLVLVDEPETSLHPGAQKQLLKFFLEQIKIKHIQVIVATHSMEFIELLPNKAIKVLEDNGFGSIRIINECSPHIALHRLGANIQSKMQVLVEDAAAKALVERAAKLLDPGEQATFEILVIPGGAETLLAQTGPQLMSINAPSYLYLDGDKKHVNDLTDPDALSPSQQRDIAGIFRTEIGFEPKFNLNGGADREGIAALKLSSQIQYLRWLKNHLSYLPRSCPEEIVLRALYPTDHAQINDSTSKAFKEALGQKNGIADMPSGQQLGVMTFLLNDMPNENEDLSSIAIQLQKWVCSYNEKSGSTKQSPDRN